MTGSLALQSVWVTKSPTRLERLDNSNNSWDLASLRASGKRMEGGKEREGREEEAEEEEREELRKGKAPRPDPLLCHDGHFL